MTTRRIKKLAVTMQDHLMVLTARVSIIAILVFILALTLITRLCRHRVDNINPALPVIRNIYHNSHSSGSFR